MGLPAFVNRLLGGRSAVNSADIFPLIADPYTGCIGTMESEHLHIHAGRGFQLSGEITSLAASLSTDFFVLPFSGSGIHFRDYRISSNGAPVKVELYEDPTIAITGTQAAPVNRNRYSSKVSSSGIFHSASASALGTFLDITRIEGTGVGANVTGEVEGFPIEWIMNPANTYLMRVSNENGSAVKLTYRMFWYELGL